MNNKKPGFLCDLPVRISIWIRPNILKKQFDIIKQARPSILFLVSDGGRNEEENNLIKKSRQIFEYIDWDCTIYRLYEETNLGMYAMSKKSRDFIFGKVDRCAFMEDDYIPSVSYFYFIAELLEKYKDDKRIAVINGMNHLEHYGPKNTDYFFSNELAIWGVAYWKRTYDLYFKRDFENDTYVKERIMERGKFINRKKLAKSIFKNNYSELYKSGTEFNLRMIQLTQNQLIIVPTKNMISNKGSDASATHARELKLMAKGIRRVFNMKTYEYDFPLRHPQYVMPDHYHSKKVRRIMGKGYPHIYLWRRIESGFRHVFYGEFGLLTNSIQKFFIK